ncbi:MAG TPA: hypothetical protein VF092_28680 [Longimicrobium sp.]
MWNILFVIGAAMAVGSVVVQATILLPRSRQFRTDLRPGQHFGRGRSPFWQLNALNPRNYESPEGRRFYRTLLAATAIQWTGAILMFISLVVLASV